MAAAVSDYAWVAKKINQTIQVWKYIYRFETHVDQNIKKSRNGSTSDTLFMMHPNAAV